MKKTLSLLLAFSLWGCSHYVINDAGYVRPPKNEKFSYKNRFSPLKDLSIIDTTVIYYLSDSYYYKDNKDYKNRDEYIRFYANGKFKTQGLKSDPNVDDINDVQKGIVGYYIVQGNAVKMQVYTDINAGSIQLEYGIIDKDKNLVVMHDNPNIDFNIGYNEEKIKRLIERSPFSPKVFVKTKIEGLVYKAPNW